MWSYSGRAGARQPSLFATIRYDLESASQLRKARQQDFTFGFSDLVIPSFGEADSDLGFPNGGKSDSMLFFIWRT